MNDQHTPLTAAGRGVFRGEQIVAETTHFDDHEKYNKSIAFARRIVAAVNATAGIPTADLQTIPPNSIGNYFDLKKDSAELNHRRQENVELAKLLATAVHFAPSQDVQWVRDARAALEKHTAHPTTTNTSSTAETSEEDLRAQVIANLTRKLGNAIKALRMIATYTPETGQCDDGYSPKYIAQAAIAPYGPGPMIQERPRPGQDHTGEPDPSDLYREWKDAQDDADQPTAYDP